MGYTRSADRLIAELSRLPGVGRRAAQTMVLDILKLPQEEAMRLARLILEVKKKTRACTSCFNLTEEELCPICSDHVARPRAALRGGRGARSGGSREDQGLQGPVPHPRRRALAAGGDRAGGAARSRAARAHRRRVVPRDPHRHQPHARGRGHGPLSRPFAQGAGGPSHGAGTLISAIKSPAEKLAQWRMDVEALYTQNRFDLLPAQEPGFHVADEPNALFTEEGPGIIVLGLSSGNGTFARNDARIDGFSITGADHAGAIVVNGYAEDLVISNNRVFGNNGIYGGGIRVGHPFLVAKATM